MHASPRSAVLNYPDYEVIVVNDGSSDRTLEIAESYPYCRIISQPNKGLERRAQCRRRGGDRRDRRLYRQRLRRRPRLADLSRRQDGGERPCRLRRPEFPAARRQPGAGRGGGVARAARPMSCSATRSPSTSPAATWRSAATRCWRSAASIRSIAPPATMSTSAGGFRMRATPSASARRPWSGISAATRCKAYINQQRGYGKAEALVYSKHPFRFNLFGQAKWLGRIYGDLSTSLLLSRRPVIYSGVFGRGLFQTLYEPPSSLTAFLPLTFEWSVAAIVLALAGIVGGGWWLAACRAAARDLGDVRQRRAEGADRQALQRAEGAGAGGVADLSRPVAARLGAPQMAHPRDPARSPTQRCRRPSSGRESPGASAPLALPFGARTAPKRRP